MVASKPLAERQALKIEASFAWLAQAAILTSYVYDVHLAAFPPASSVPTILQFFIVPTTLNAAIYVTRQSHFSFTAITSSDPMNFPPNIPNIPFLPTPRVNVHPNHTRQHPPTQSTVLKIRILTLHSVGMKMERKRAELDGLGNGDGNNKTTTES